MDKLSKLNVELTPIEQAEESCVFPENISQDSLLSFLKLSTELAADEVFWMKADSEIIYVNNAACEKLGYKRHELIGMKVWQWDPLFPKEEWPSFWQEIKAKKHIDFETKHQKKNAEVFPVRIKGHLVEHQGEELLFAYVSDISDIRKHQEEQENANAQIQALLEHEKKKFEEFVNLAPVGIAINRTDSGKFEYINSEFSRFTGYSIEELNAMDYWQLTPSKYEEQEYKQLADMAERGCYGPYRKEYIHKKGHTYPVLLSGIKITAIDGEDYIWSVVQDISEQIATEKQIQLSRELADANALRLQLANDSAGIGIWEWDLQNNTLVWDDWMYKLYGVNKTEFSGVYEAWTSRVHPDDIEEVKAKLQVALEGKGVYEPEFRVVHSNGQVRVIKASAEVVRDESGLALKVIGVNYDITDKVNAIKKLAQAKREAENATKAKSDFLANMSHEIRTPMNAILGGLQLLQSAPLDNELKSILDNAYFSAHSLLTIINDILDYSKIESNKLHLEVAPFSLIKVLDSIKYDLDLMVSNKGIKFLVSIDKNFVDGWLGDIVRVKQILLNLASNAVKFTKQGSVKINVTCSLYQGKKAIYLEVIDSGIGMSAEVQQKIFERFTQADSSTTRKYGGTGLGMSITISLVKMMDGDLQLTSELGKGTKISVLLPLQQTILESHPEKAKSFVAPNLAGQKILISEDNKINQVIIQNMLKPTGASLTTVENGKLAVEAVANGDFDLVFMDIHMPEMDGIEAQHKINLLNNKLPVIALTANVMVEDVKDYMARGFAGHISKPIDVKVLYGLLAGYANPMG